MVKSADRWRDLRGDLIVKSVAERGDASPAVILDVISAATRISSDHEKAALLLLLAQRYRTDDQILPALEDAADTIGSDYEHGRVWRALRGRARTQR